MIFANVAATGKDKKPIENTLYCVNWNQYGIFKTTGVELPPPGTFFDYSEFNGGEITIVASKKSINLMLLSNKRNKNSLKLLKPEVFTTFADGVPYAITKPHNYYYHKKPKAAKKRYVLNLLTGEFTLMSYEDFCAEGLKSFRKGTVVYRHNGVWKKLLSAPKVKIDLNEVEVHELVELVSENFYFWLNKGKFYGKCVKCKNSCKQNLSISGLQCKKFDPIVARKKTERKPREKKAAAYKRPPKIKKLEVVDTGSLLAEEVKRRFAKR